MPRGTLELPSVLASCPAQKVGVQALHSGFTLPAELKSNPHACGWASLAAISSSIRWEQSLSHSTLRAAGRSRRQQERSRALTSHMKSEVGTTSTDLSFPTVCQRVIV